MRLLRQNRPTKSESYANCIASAERRFRNAPFHQYRNRERPQRVLFAIDVVLKRLTKQNIPPHPPTLAQRA